MKTTNKILVIDLEATCWENEVPPKGQQSEIIEIGICELDADTGAITKNKGILIQPKYSKISAFCTQLTTITPELIDKEGMPFEAAIEILRTEYEASRYTWASYGAYDLKMLREQCLLRREQYPMSKHHINVKNFFARTKGLSRNPGMARALDMLGWKLEGTHHRGMDDARNTAKILDWCLQRS